MLHIGEINYMNIGSPSFISNMTHPTFYDTADGKSIEVVNGP